MLSFNIDIPRGMSREMKKIVLSWVDQCQSRVANKVSANVKTVFALEGARGGNPKWKPVTGIARKFRSVDKNAPTLVDSGKLRDSIYGSVHKDPKMIYVAVGTDLQYARNHNDGEQAYTPLPERNNINRKTYTIPQRPFLFITREDVDDIKNIFKNTALRFKP